MENKQALLEHAAELHTTEGAFRKAEQMYRAVLQDPRTGDLGVAIMRKHLSKAEVARATGYSEAHVGVAAIVWYAVSLPDDGTDMVALHRAVWSCRDGVKVTLKGADGGKVTVELVKPQPLDAIRFCVGNANTRGAALAALQQLMGESTTAAGKAKQKKDRSDAELLVSVANLITKMSGDGSLTPEAVGKVTEALVGKIKTDESVATTEDVTVSV